MRSAAWWPPLFSLHPLHVESVAWVAERKDVLSTFFWLLTMLAYVAFVRAPSAARYAVLLAAFAAGLLAKPMLVTLPCVLLLFDYWPLGRWSRDRKRLLLEKIPLFLLAAGSSAITFLVQRSGGAMKGSFPFDERLANAVASYAAYLGQMLWPAGLSVYYPHSRADLSIVQIGLGAGVLAAGFAAAFYFRRDRPWVAVGWLWYVGTLVPVIGLVQVGEQARADRYTYVPLVGIFLIVAWAVPELAARLRLPPRAATVAGVVVTLLLAAATSRQTRHWKDSETLFRQALAVTERNYMAHNQLGEILSRTDRLEEAIEHYRMSIEIRPEFPNTHVNMGTARMWQGRPDEARLHFVQALRTDPELVLGHYNLGLALNALGDPEGAIASYRNALRYDPGYAAAHENLANSLARRGDFDEAVEHYRTAIRLKPRSGQLRVNFARVLAYLGRHDEARVQVEAARRAGTEPPPDLLRSLSGS